MKARTTTAGLLLVATVGWAGQEPSLRIVSPAAGAAVERHTEVTLEAEGLRGQPVVLVHPSGTPEYWVQPRLRQVGRNRWTTLIYVGRPGDVDAGREFEILAVVQGTVPLVEGQALQDWPASELRSAIVRVRRK
jgi:hypothetical protein